MEPLTIFYFTLAALYVVFTAAGLVLFVRRRNREPIRSREWKPVIGTTVDCIFFFVVLAVSDALKYDPVLGAGVSCHLLIWPSVLITPMLAMPSYIRAFVLFYKFQLATVRSKGITDRDASWLYRNRWMMSPYVQFFTTFGTMALSVVATVVILETWDVPSIPTLDTSTCATPGLYVIVTQIVISSLITGALLVMLRPTKDQFYFKTELGLVNIFTGPFAILWAVSIFHPELFPQKYYTHNIWIYSLFTIYVAICVWFPVYLTYSREFADLRPYDEEVSISSSQDRPDSLDLQTVLEPVALHNINSATLLEAVFRDEELLLAFKQYAITCFCVENVNFIVDVRKFSVLSGDSVKAEAVRIQQLYFQPSSPFELNLDDSIVASISEAIDEGNIDTHVFRPAERKILHLLLTDTLHRWRGTREFAKAVQASSLADAIDLDTPGALTPAAMAMRQRTSLGAAKPAVVTSLSSLIGPASPPPESEPDVAV